MQSVPYPMQALLDRMGPHLPDSTWSRFMPPKLLERQRQCTIADWVACASSSGDSVSTMASGSSCMRLVLDRDAVGRGMASPILGTCSGDSAVTEDGVDANGLLPGVLGVKGRVWLLAQDLKGCRAVQDAFEEASAEAQMELAAELHGHVAKAFRCPHANHVLQKCILLLPPEHSQFVVDELLEREGLVGQAARHRYGCRILQQLLKKCPSSQLQLVADQLLEDALLLSCHPFANFVMQQLLANGSELHRQSLTRLLECNVSVVCKSSPGCNVVGAALRHGSHDDCLRVAHAILKDTGRLRLLTNMRAGSVIIELISQVVDLRSEQFAKETSIHHASCGWTSAELLQRAPALA